MGSLDNIEAGLLTPILEISAALVDLAESMDRREAQASEAIKSAVQAAAAEISSPLADLLAAIEKAGPETARAIAAALSGMRQAQPAVHVTVPVPEVNVTVPVATGWRFEVDYHPDGDIKGLTAKRLAA